jgi:hypothetical protein
VASEVLEQDHTAVTEVVYDLAGSVADAFVGQDDVRGEKFGEAFPHRCEGRGFAGMPGASQVPCDHHAGLTLDEELEGGKRCTELRVVVEDPVTVEGHIEIEPDEHPP